MPVKNPLVVLPIITTPTNLGTIALGERKPVVQRFPVEVTADCHAQFGTDLFSLIDQAGGGGFAPVAVDGSAGSPVLNAKSLVIPAGQYGLVCPWVDQAAQTCVIVFKYTGANSSVIMGDYSSAGDTAAGWYLRNNAGNLQQLVRPGAAPVTVSRPGAAVDGDWLCAVITEDATSVRIKICDGTLSTSAAARVPSSRRRSIGNRYIAGSYTATLEVAECLHIPATVNTAGMTALYTQAKARAAVRGEVVL